MNMKQSCKALICAIEGELDGRHCTEEQAAAILDHALPSLTEALARVEAERDNAVQGAIKWSQRTETAQAQLAEAVGLLNCVVGADVFGNGTAKDLDRGIANFLASHAEAGQKEAQVDQAKIDWINDYRVKHGVSVPVAAKAYEAQGAQGGDERIALLERELERERERADMAEVELQHARAALATQPALPSQTNNFHQGIFYAVAELQRSFEMTTMCAAILRAAGLDDADCSSVDEFDRISLREIAALSSLNLTGLDGQPAVRGAEHE